MQLVDHCREDQLPRLCAVLVEVQVLDFGNFLKKNQLLTLQLVSAQYQQDLVHFRKVHFLKSCRAVELSLMQLQSQELEIDHLGYLQDEKYKFSVVESSIVISERQVQVR